MVEKKTEVKPAAQPYTPPQLEATEPVAQVKRRQLTKEERLVVMRQKQDFKDLIEKWDFDHEQISRNLDRGFDIEVKSKKVTARRKLQQIEGEITNWKKQIEIMDDQQKNGVVVKERPVAEDGGEVKPQINITELLLRIEAALTKSEKGDETKES